MRKLSEMRHHEPAIARNHRYQSQTRFTARRLSAIVCLCGLSLGRFSWADAPTAPDQPADTAQPMGAAQAAHGQLGPGENTLYIGLMAPKGAKLTRGSPVEIRASGRGLSFPERVKVKLEPGAHIPVPVKISSGSSEQALFKISYFWCHDTALGADDEHSGQCVRETAQVTVNLDVSGDRGGGEAYFDYQPTRAAR